MMPHRNLLQPAEERQLKKQAAVKEVASTRSTQSTNIEKMEMETATAATGPLAGCPNVDNKTCTDPLPVIKQRQKSATLE